MADEEIRDEIAEHVQYAHAHGCAAAYQVVAGTAEMQPALVKLIGPQPVCVSFTTFEGQGNATVTEEDWQWLVAHGGKPGGARADGTLQTGDDGETRITVTLAPRPDSGERTLTVGTVVLRLVAGEWDHLVANQDVYAED